VVHAASPERRHPTSGSTCRRVLAHLLLHPLIGAPLLVLLTVSALQRDPSLRHLCHWLTAEQNGTALVNRIAGICIEDLQGEISGLRNGCRYLQKKLEEGIPTSDDDNHRILLFRLLLDLNILCAGPYQAHPPSADLSTELFRSAAQ
jgi:hypothetical protein